MAVAQAEAVSGGSAGAALVGLEPFTCTRSVTGGTLEVTLSGELDIATTSIVDDVLRYAEAESRLIVLDLRQLRFIDVSGAHLLTAADRRIRRGGGRLVVVPGDGIVRWFLDLVRVGDVLELVDESPAHNDSTNGDAGGAQLAIDELRLRRSPDAGPANRAAAAERLERVTCERDELRMRVAALEHELLDLVYEPAMSTPALALWETDAGDRRDQAMGGSDDPPEAPPAG